MKKQSKKKSIILTSIIGLCVAIVAVLAFVPMKFGNATYKSFLKAIPLGTELHEGLSVTYTFESEHAINSIKREKAITSTVAGISEILEDKGYIGATVRQLGDDKIQVQLAEPIDSSDTEDTLELLGASGIGAGKFELKTENTTEASALLVGEDIKSVSTISQNGYYFTKVIFSDTAKAKIQKLEAAAAEGGTTNTYYMFFGESNTLTSGVSFTYSDNFYEDDLYIGGYEDKSINDSFELWLKAGSFGVELESADILDFNYIETEDSNLLLILCIFNLIIIALFIGLSIYRFGILSLSVLASNVFYIGLTLFLFAVMPWIEVMASTMIIALLCISLFNLAIFAQYEQARKEYKTGKPLENALDSAFRKTYKQTIAISIFLFLSGIIIAVACHGAIQMAGTLISITSISTLFVSSLFSKGFANLMFGFTNDDGSKYLWGGKK